MSEVLSESMQYTLDIIDYCYIELEDFTVPVTFISMSGEELFSGLLKDLLNQIRSDFAFGRDLSIITPVFLIGTTRVRYLKKLVVLIDWTQPTHTYTVIFQNKDPYWINKHNDHYYWINKHRYIYNDIYIKDYKIAAIKNYNVITLGYTFKNEPKIYPYNSRDYSYLDKKKRVSDSRYKNSKSKWRPYKSDSYRK